MNNSEIDWEPGYKLQSRKYIIKNQLKKGGFGVTYNAYHEVSKKNYVIKVPLDIDNIIKDLELWKNEATLLAELDDHRHIVRIIDAFEENFKDEENFQEKKIPVIVLEFIEGEDLAKIIASGKKIPEDKAVKYIYQIGTTIVYLKKNGLVHGDIHPGNIMIKDNDEAVLIDFGHAEKHRNFVYNEQTEGQYHYTNDIYYLATCLSEIVSGDREVSEPLKKAIQKGIDSKPSDSMSEWLNMLPGTENYRSSGHGMLKLPLWAISVLAMDSQELQRLIQEEEWLGANIETFKRVCQVNSEYQRGGLSPTDLIKFMNEHLKPINNIYRLWFIRYAR